MKRAIVASALLALELASPGSAMAQEPACALHMAQACYVVHGGLLTANGTPSFRIVASDTGRVLGISGGEEPPLPSAVRKALAPDMFSNKLSGDYVVCPQTEEQPREMQMVCVKSASNLTLEPR